MEIVIICSVILALAVGRIVYDKLTHDKKILARIRNEYGQFPARTFTELKQSSVGCYFRAHASDRAIDDITRNDLGLDGVYMEINNTGSCIGEEYLYSVINDPSFDKAELDERERVIRLFSEDAGLREKVAVRMHDIGTLRNISVYEYMRRLGDVRVESNFIHICQALLLLAAIAFIFVDPPKGVLATVAVFTVNVLTYFKRKSEIEAYFAVIACIIRMIDSARELSKLDDDRLSLYTERLKKCAASFAGMRRGSSLVVPKGISTDILQSFLDYIRMAFHMDLIKFNLILDTFLNRDNDFEELFRVLGFLDAMISVASYREYIGRWCVPETPELGPGQNVQLDTVNIAHPLIDEPVVNSIKTDSSVLITGSNASGKSTFIKTLAINTILAQSIHTVLADSFSCPAVRVMSSMALADNLASGESYYIVEIRSLKRILDAMQGETPVLCFIDEVLRGTNTLERIAASAQILRTMAGGRSLCFAASHDIELTFILEKIYSNYHFEEHVEANDVLFDYRLKEGRAMTRNAIKLLGMLGYSDDIIGSAQQMAADYLQTNDWKILERI